MSSKNAKEARQARAEELARIRQKQAERDKRQRLLVTLAVGIPLLILAGIAAWIIIQAAQPEGPKGEQVVPPSASAMGEPLVLNPDASESLPVLDIYEDFQCPYCGQLEKTIGDTIYTLADTNKAKVQLHMMSFLDNSLGNDASVRALRGLLAADEQGMLAPYHKLVYINQPEKEGDGWTDAQLRSFAVDAGVPDMDAWDASFNSGKWDQYIASIQAAATSDQITGTPTVKLNGADITSKITGPDALVALVTGDSQG